MAAAYDTYDYPSYWEGREYEHGSEIICLKAYLDRIPKIKSLLEVGTGFGRLTPTYFYRANKIILSDPSAKLLKLARERFTHKKVRFIQSKVENLPGKIRGKSIDVAICVRVLHHIKDLKLAFSVTRRLLKKDGYLILEFPNKCHSKATIAEFLRGNFTFLLDIFPKELKSSKSRKKTLPFLNYHPDLIKEELTSQGFKIIESRSVSNVRSVALKKVLQTNILLSIERYLQKPLAKINFGPSIFVLAQKTE